MENSLAVQNPTAIRENSAISPLISSCTSQRRVEILENSRRGQKSSAQRKKTLSVKNFYYLLFVRRASRKALQRDEGHGLALEAERRLPRAVKLGGTSNRGRLAVIEEYESKLVCGLTTCFDFEPTSLPLH
jgi:hypothetical protein